MRDDQERELFRQEMSRQTAPDALVADTLQKMMAEYDRIEQKRERPSLSSRIRRAVRSSGRGFAVGGLAVAMAVVICVFAYRQDAVQLSFDEFACQTDMRLEMGLRAGSEGEADASAIRDELEGKLAAAMGKYARTDFQFRSFALNAQGPELWAAQAVYDGEKGESFRIAVTNFPTSVHDALEGGAAQELGGVSVYTGKDTQTGDLYAVWASSGRYVQLQLPGNVSWNDRELARLIEAAAGMLM